MFSGRRGSPENEFDQSLGKQTAPLADVELKQQQTLKVSDFKRER